tara:strand:+ start:500 stop:850 length:351 start_codon:yes stop_codon:yes gene_type:complete
MKNKKLYTLLGILVIITLLLSIITIGTLIEKPELKTIGGNIIFVTTPQKTSNSLPTVGQSLTDQKKQNTITNNHIEITINNHHSYNNRYYPSRYYKSYRDYNPYRTRYYYPHYIIY